VVHGAVKVGALLLAGVSTGVYFLTGVLAVAIVACVSRREGAPMTPPPVPARRAGDGSRGRRAMAWLQRWGLLIEGLVLLIVCVVIGIGTYRYAQDQKDTTQAARVSCERSKKFGPYLVRKYSVDHTFGGAAIHSGDTEAGLLRSYAETIPTDCPS
jgi:TRAP-type C4-dicarboxylate transport system permease large subunit